MRIMICVLLAVCFPTAAAASKPDVMGLTYTEARETLARAGFKPLSREQAIAMNPYGQTALTQEKVDDGFPEVVNCTGTGIPFCSFMLTDKSGIVFQVHVYTPEDDGPSRVEVFESTEYHKLSDDRILTRLQLLEERIGLANSQAPIGIMAMPPNELSACDKACIIAETRNEAVQLEELPNHIDNLTGFHIPDFRNIALTELWPYLANYMLTPIPSFNRAKLNFSNRLTYVVDQISDGALHRCVWLKNGLLECDLLYTDLSGYLYRLTVAGKDLGSVSVKAVALVNGLDEYASYSRPALIVELRRAAARMLYDGDKHAYRAVMKELLASSTDEYESYARILDETSYEAQPCTTLVSLAYHYATSSMHEMVKAQVIEQMANSLYQAGCIRLAYR